MTSVLNVDTIANKAGTGPVGLTKQAAAKAFLNYDHLNDTIKKSFNESSVSDTAEGEFTFNFTSSFNDAVYSVSTTQAVNAGSTRNAAILGVGCSSFNNVNTASSYATGSIQMESGRNALSTSNGARADFDRACVQIFGDLA